MIPVRTRLDVDARQVLKRIQLDDGYWGTLNLSTGIFTYEPPGPITFISVTFHLDTRALDPDGGGPDDEPGVGEPAPSEGDLSDVRDCLEPRDPSESGS